MLTIKKAIIYLLVATAIVSFTPEKGSSKKEIKYNTNQEEKTVTITLTLSKWNTTITALHTSEAVSSLDGNSIADEIVKQAQKQLSDSTTKAPQKK